MRSIYLGGYIILGKIHPTLVMVLQKCKKVEMLSSELHGSLEQYQTISMIEEEKNSECPQIGKPLIFSLCLSHIESRLVGCVVVLFNDADSSSDKVLIINLQRRRQG